jgi:hypothetical protein
MITKSDWEAVHEQMMAEERRKLGDPPTFDQVLAYMRGELSSQEEERVRALLVYYPELAQSVFEPFPAGDEGSSISDDELARRWSFLESRIDGTRRGVIRFPLARTALAAALVLVFAGLYWNAKTELRRMQSAAIAPRIIPGEFTELRPGGTRGGDVDPMQLVPEGDLFAVAVPLLADPSFENFRIEIVEPAASQPLWQSQVVSRPGDPSIPLLIPRAMLPAGRYDVVLYGVDGSRQERLISYPVRVSDR